MKLKIDFLCIFFFRNDISYIYEIMKDCTLKIFDNSCCNP